MIKEGMTAPDFSLADQTGKKVRLSAFKGKDVVLYFYPKDDTLGCTMEACGIRDTYTEFRKLGIVVLGISPDDKTSHRKFSEKYNLPFTLLADTDKKVSTDYEAYKQKSFLGKKYMGIERTTFLIDKKGIIKKIFNKVNPRGHEKQILEFYQKGKPSK